ncbi:MAG: hypothetical protein Tsb0010_07900 [Parvularculaceae bacterium]
MKIARSTKICAIAFIAAGGAFSVHAPAAAQADAACPAIDSRAWTARIEPDPFTNELRLIVFGQMLMPTPGYELMLTPTLNAKSYPPIQFFDLAIAPPSDAAAQALAWHDVVYEGPADAPAYRMVKVRCGRREIASIPNVASAPGAPRF